MTEERRRGIYRTEERLTEEERSMVLDVIKVLRAKPCEDAISRQALRARFDSLNEVYDGMSEEEKHEAYIYGQIIRAIDDAPLVIPKPKTGKWIPVSERSPESSGVYNVTRIIDEKRISDSCYYDGGGIWYDDNRINHERKYLDDVTAWMPLPEPCEEGENE